jgi:hypothetical protein
MSARASRRRTNAPRKARNDAPSAAPELADSVAAGLARGLHRPPAGNHDVAATTACTHRDTAAAGSDCSGADHRAPLTGPTSGLYTYVLAGDVGGQAGNGAADDRVAAQARASLQALLAEVEETTQVHNGTAPFAPPIAATMNQFCIPTLAANLDATTITLAQYDFDLSTQYRDWFQVMLAGNARLRGAMQHSGPFLVATRAPMNELVASVASQRVVTLDSPVLVMDMSGYPPEAMPYFVDAFRDAVASTRPLPTGALKPLKPKIVAYLSAINQGIPLVAEVWSKTLKAFDGKA